MDGQCGTKYPAPDDCYAGQLQNFGTGTFDIFVDDMSRPALSAKISLRKGDNSNCYDNDYDRCILDTVGNAYLGFTASTGGERAQGRTVNGAHSTATGTAPMAIENSAKMLGAAQRHDVLSFAHCNRMGCVPV